MAIDQSKCAWCLRALGENAKLIVVDGVTRGVCGMGCMKKHQDNKTKLKSPRNSFRPTRVKSSSATTANPAAPVRQSRLGSNPTILHRRGGVGR